MILIIRLENGWAWDRQKGGPISLISAVPSREEQCSRHWKPSAVMMPTLSLLAAPQVATTCGATCDDEVGIMTTSGFQRMRTELLWDCSIMSTQAGRESGVTILISRDLLLRCQWANYHWNQHHPSHNTTNFAPWTLPHNNNCPGSIYTVCSVHIEQTINSQPCHGPRRLMAS